MLYILLSFFFILPRKYFLILYWSVCYRWIKHEVWHLQCSHIYWNQFHNDIWLSQKPPLTILLKLKTWNFPKILLSKELPNPSVTDGREQPRWYSCNARENSWTKVKNSIKLGHDRKILTSAFAQFLTAINPLVPGVH